MKSTNTKPKQHRKLLVLGALLAIVLALSGFFAYRHHQKTQAIAEERRQYNLAEKDIAQEVREITAAFGVPVRQQASKTCGHSSVEFGQGDLYCSTGVTFVYNASDLEAAKAATNEISTFIAKGRIFETRTTSDALAKPPTPIELLSVIYSDESRLDCSANFVFYTNADRQDGYDAYPEVQTGGLSTYLSCGSRPAKSAYYPLEDS